MPDLKLFRGVSGAMKVYTIGEAAGIITIRHAAAGTPFGQHEPLLHFSGSIGATDPKDNVELRVSSGVGQHQCSVVSSTISRVSKLLREVPSLWAISEWILCMGLCRSGGLGPTCRHQWLEIRL